MTIQQPNGRLDHSSKRAKDPTSNWGLAAEEALKEEPKYGNHAHVPYEQKKWIALPSKAANFLQQHVDFCCLPYVKLEDLAYEACQLNPNLIYRPVRDVQITSFEHSPTKPRSKQHRELVPAPTPTQSQPQSVLHLYKGRDVTEAVKQAYELCYIKGFKFADTLSIQQEYGIPYNNLRILVHREQANRLSTVLSTELSTEED